MNSSQREYFNHSSETMRLQTNELVEERLHQRLLPIINFRPLEQTTATTSTLTCRSKWSPIQLPNERKFSVATLSGCNNAFVFSSTMIWPTRSTILHRAA